MTFVIDGVEMLLDFALETLAQVWDFVCAILDYFGTAWGTVLGWILSLVGGLFGWNEIKANKDIYKQQVRDFGDGLPDQLPHLQSTYETEIDTWFTSAHNSLDSWFGTVADDYGTDAVRLGNASDKTPSDYVGDDDGATWLIDKVTAVIDELFGVNPPLGNSARNKWADMGKNLSDTLDSKLSSTASTMVTSIMSLDEPDSDLGDAMVSALIALFQGVADGVLTAGESLISTVFEILQFLIDNAGKLVDWLDTSLSIPFFSAFYEAAIGSDCSILDIACLMLAIPVTLAGGSPELAGGTDNEVIELTVIIALLSVLTIAGDGIGALPGQKPVGIALFVTGLAIPLVALGLKDSLPDDKASHYEKAFWFAMALGVSLEFSMAIVAAEDPERNMSVPFSILFVAIGITQAVATGGYVIDAVDETNPDTREKELLGAAMLGVGSLATVLRVLMLWRDPPAPAQLVVYAAGQSAAMITNVALNAAICGVDTEPET